MMKEIVYSMVVGLIDFVISTIFWLVMAACLILVVAVFAFPVIMAAHYSLWWLMCYIVYFVAIGVWSKLVM